MLHAERELRRWNGPRTTVGTFVGTLGVASAVGSRRVPSDENTAEGGENPEKPPDLPGFSGGIAAAEPLQLLRLWI